MKNLLLIFVFSLLSQTILGQTKSSPGVPGYGKIWDIENAVQPDQSMEYKIVVDLKSTISDPDAINRGLNNVARMINLHRVGGIPADKLKVVVAVHGGATGLVMIDDGYQNKYGVNNPNLALITELKKSGVEIYVCGQSLIARGYDFDQVNPEIKVGLSMLTIVTEHMNKDYKLLVFN
jgi:intracellular sulfur oxidation DsrE/DsrF family protein